MDLKGFIIPSNSFSLLPEKHGIAARWSDFRHPIRCILDLGPDAILVHNSCFGRFSEVELASPV